MGMFDYVCIKVTCPVCGRELTEFQTKDSDCSLNYLLPGESVMNPKYKYVDTYSYCEHEKITVERFGQPDDITANSVWIDVMIPVNKDGVLSKDVRKYKINAEERFWNSKEMADAKYPTNTLDPSQEVVEYNKQMKELRSKGPYKSKVSIDYEAYASHVAAITRHFESILQEIEEKNKNIKKYCLERNVVPLCDNCMYLKENRCHRIENIEGIKIDMTNDLPDSRTCCEWAEKDIKTEW